MAVGSYVRRIFLLVSVAVSTGILPLSHTPSSADEIKGFRSPESLIRNLYAYYGDRSSDLSSGLPRDAATAQQFFDPSLRAAWSLSRHQPYDFFVQSPGWKLGAVSISILRRQFDKTYVAVAFDNRGHAVTLNFIVLNGPDGWLITDVESPHDSLRMFLAQYRS
jgi:hypothetical protein